MRRVSLFVTCILDALYPQVGEAVLKVLERWGWQVSFPPEQTCCGLPLYNNGYREEAAKIARHTVSAMAGEDPVVVPGGSCAWMLRKVYPELVGADGERLAARVKELSELLVESDAPPVGPTAAVRKVTYHPSCHLLRGLGIEKAPLELLRAQPHLQLVPLAGAGECCGFGGTFAVRYGAVSTEIMKDKLAHAAESGAERLVVTDPGCLLHLDGGARRAGAPFSVCHLAELLAEPEPESNR
jgi:L-lactate dehydrogenase complex protein LldE